MKKKVISISVDEERFHKLNEEAEALGMNRTRYINSLINKAESLEDVPLEILYLNEFFKECKKIEVSDEDKKVIQEPIKKVLAIKAGKEDEIHEHIQSDKKKQQKKSR